MKTEQKYLFVNKHLLGQREDMRLWDVDAPYPNIGDIDSYEYCFRRFLTLFEVSTFEQLLQERGNSSRSSHVLDLFGSGWFLNNPHEFDSITGFRLKNTTELQLRCLYNELNNGLNPVEDVARYS